MVAVALIGDDEAIRRRRTLHWINEFGTPVQIAIDGGTPVTAATGMGETTIGEGQHHVAISGPIEQQLDIDLNSAYLKHWFSQPEWVLDIAGAGTLCQSTITYAVAPPPAKQEFFVGKPFYPFADVDYPFITPPASMHVNNANSRIVKTELEWIRSQPNEIFNRLADASPDVALAFAESWLPSQPDNIELLTGYVSLADEGGAADRAEKFLKTNCAHRPVLVNWHRVYQGLLQSHGKQAQAIAEYDAALKTEPQNGRLLYLRGRIDADYDARNRYYEQSETAEPDLPWPWYATAAETASQGNWAECLRNIDKATERKLDPLMVPRPASRGADGGRRFRQAGARVSSRIGQAAARCFDADQLVRRAGRRGASGAGTTGAARIRAAHRNIELSQHRGGDQGIAHGDSVYNRRFRSAER